MGTFGTVEVIDRGGWRREFLLSKNLVHIGSDPSNDIVLGAERGAGVAPRHLQLLALPGGGAEAGGLGAVRIVNLGRADIPFDPRSTAVQAQLLHPWSAVGIGDGTRFRLGDFTLIFHLTELAELTVAGRPVQAVAQEAAVQGVPEVAGTSGTAASIGLRLHLPETTLQVGRPLEGVISVRNLGDRPGVQVQLALEGLDVDCYEMGPGPILFPNAEKDVFLRLINAGKPRPVAGDHRIRIAATAPQAYPGQRAEVFQVVHVAPFYAQEVHIAETGPGAAQIVGVEICNTGNVRSRYELRAEDPAAGLEFWWLLNKAPLAGLPALPEAGSAPASAAPERPALAGMSGQVRRSAEKVRGAVRIGEGISNALGSLAVMLPPSIGAPLRRAAGTLWQGRTRVTGAMEAPARAKGALSSIIPGRGQAPRPAEPVERARQVQRAQPARAMASPTAQTPYVEPGERLLLELRVAPLRRRRGGARLIKVTASSAEKEAIERGAPSAAVERNVQVAGLPWLLRLLPFALLLLAAIIALGLVYRLAHGG